MYINKKLGRYKFIVMLIQVILFSLLSIGLFSLNFILWSNLADAGEGKYITILALLSFLSLLIELIILNLLREHTYFFHSIFYEISTKTLLNSKRIKLEKELFLSLIFSNEIKEVVESLAQTNSLYLQNFRYLSRLTDDNLNLCKLRLNSELEKLNWKKLGSLAYVLKHKKKEYEKSKSKYKEEKELEKLKELMKIFEDEFMSELEKLENIETENQRLKSLSEIEIYLEKE